MADEIKKLAEQTQTGLVERTRNLSDKTIVGTANISTLLDGVVTEADSLQEIIDQAQGETD